MGRRTAVGARPTGHPVARRGGTGGLGISRVTMTRLVREGHFKIYENPLDKRQKLVEEADVEALLRLRPIRTRAEGKAAA